MARPALIVHAGAGAHDPPLTEARRTGCRAALRQGWEILRGGGRALDAVCDAVATMEDDPTFNAGLGSCLTAAGTVEMDASVMDGEGLRAGAVGVVCGVRNPVRLARTLLEEGRHVLLCGPATDAYARARAHATCAQEEMVTERQRERWRRWLPSPGTVGATALDASGHFAAATSTGGIMGKEPGRVGDSAIVGAGTYADDRSGAASATGDGEAIMRIAMTKWAVDALLNGLPADAVARAAISQLQDRAAGRGGIIVVDTLGRVGHAFNTEHMTVGYMHGGLAEAVILA